MKPLRLSQTDVIEKRFYNKCWGQVHHLTPTFIIEPEVMHDVYYITLPNDRLSSGDVFVRMQKV